MLRCAQLARSNVLDKYACARQFFRALASEIFLSSLDDEVFQPPAKTQKRSSRLNFQDP
jgi:hypothetical protein